MKRKISLIIAASIASLFLLTSAVPGETVTPVVKTPARTLAALGDSLTQAANACEPWQECPEKSWSTGAYDEPGNLFYEPITIREHLQALLTKENGKELEVHNNARSYTKVSDLPNQAQLAVTQSAEFITILSGANDICSPGTVEGITSPEDFRTSVKETLNIISGQLPKSKVLVASIPNIYKLWETNHTNETAVRKWESASLCHPMLANPTSYAPEDVERRKTVLQKLVEFNSIWEEECNKRMNCLYDNNRVFNTDFTEDELSPVDYFHPSQKGQKELAKAVWQGLYINTHPYIERGKSVRSSENAPIISIVQPYNNATLSGTTYRLKVTVESENPLKQVYVDTQLGGFDLEWDEIEQVWYLQVDTTLAPNGIRTSFTVVAVDEADEIATSERITVRVYNRETEVGINPTPTPAGTLEPGEQNPDIEYEMVEPEGQKDVNSLDLSDITGQ